MRTPRHRAVPLALLALTALGACGSSGPGATPKGQADTGPITLYSGQHEETVTALAKDFEARTGVKVKVRSSDEADLANQLLQEGKDTPADVYFAENPPSLNLVDNKHLLGPVDAATLAAIPAPNSAPNGHWVGVTARTVSLAFNTKALSESQLPTSVMDLALPALKDKIGIAPGETDFQPVVTAIAKLGGVDTATRWLKGLKTNAKVYDDNEGVMAAVDAGQVATGLLDHYYWYRFNDQANGKVASALHSFAPGDAGALVDVSGAAVLAGSKHPAAAQAFLAYLVSAPAQQLIAHSQSWEYPLAAGVAPRAGVAPLPSLTPAPLTVSDLGDGAQALDLLRAVGLL